MFEQQTYEIEINHCMNKTDLRPKYFSVTKYRIVIIINVCQIT